MPLYKTPISTARTLSRTGWTLCAATKRIASDSPTLPARFSAALTSLLRSKRRA